MSAQDFGANDWLVDEMYEQYVADPTSVDPAWVEYFKINKPGSATVSNSPASNQPTPTLSKPVPPVPKSAQAPVQQPIVRDTASPQPTPADPVVKPAPVLEIGRAHV